MVMALKIKKGTRAKEFEQIPEVGNGKKMDSALDHLKGLMAP